MQEAEDGVQFLFETSLYSNWETSVSMSQTKSFLTFVAFSGYEYIGEDFISIMAF